eukprot:PhM_4_TR13405/c0_g1_i1/m.39461
MRRTRLGEMQRGLGRVAFPLLPGMRMRSSEDITNCVVGSIVGATKTSTDVEIEARLSTIMSERTHHRYNAHIRNPAVITQGRKSRVWSVRSGLHPMDYMRVHNRIRGSCIHAEQRYRDFRWHTHETETMDLNYYGDIRMTYWVPSGELKCVVHKEDSRFSRNVVTLPRENYDLVFDVCREKPFNSFEVTSYGNLVCVRHKKRTSLHIGQLWKVDFTVVKSFDRPVVSDVATYMKELANVKPAYEVELEANYAVVREELRKKKANKRNNFDDIISSFVANARFLSEQTNGRF